MAGALRCSLEFLASNASHEILIRRRRRMKKKKRRKSFAGWEL